MSFQINWIELLKDENLSLYDASKIIKKIFQQMKKEKRISYFRLFEELNLVPRSAYYWIRNERPVPIKIFWLLLQSTSLGFDLSKIMKNIKVGFRSGPRKRICSLPFKLEPKLSYFVGYLMGDGCLVKNDWTISICDEFESQIDYLDDILKKIFSLSGKKNKGRGKTTFYIYSKGLWLYLNRVFEFPLGKKKGKLKIPKIINKASKKIKKEFVRGFVDADGGIARIEKYNKIPRWLERSPQITISQSTEIFIKDLKNIMLELGLFVEGPYYNPANGGYRLTLTGMGKMKICRDFKIFRNPIKEQRLIKICNLPR